MDKLEGLLLSPIVRAGLAEAAGSIGAGKSGMFCIITIIIIISFLFFRLRNTHYFSLLSSHCFHRIIFLLYFFLCTDYGYSNEQGGLSMGGEIVRIDISKGAKHAVSTDLIVRFIINFVFCTCLCYCSVQF